MSKIITRRRVLKAGVATGTVLATPSFFMTGALAQSAEYCNAPTGDTVTLGFNVPQSGAYAEEGKDELRAYQLAVEHLNGEGDGGMLGTFSSKELKGDGILGKKVVAVTGDTATKSDVARSSAKRMIERDNAIMSGATVKWNALSKQKMIATGTPAAGPNASKASPGPM